VPLSALRFHSSRSLIEGSEPVVLTDPVYGGTLSGMTQPLRAPAWFLSDFGMIDGFFNEDHTAVVGRWSAHLGVSLLASGLVDTPFPQAIVEIDRVGEATRNRLAEEGFLPAYRPTSEPMLRLVLEPAPGETVNSLDFQSGLADFRKNLDALGIDFSSRHRTQDALVAQGWNLGEFGLLVSVVSALRPTAIAELRKLIETFLKIRAGRKLRLKIGPLTLEGSAEDVVRFISPEQIAKLLKAPKEVDGDSSQELHDGKLAAKARKHLGEK